MLNIVVLNDNSILTVTVCLDTLECCNHYGLKTLYISASSTQSDMEVMGCGRTSKCKVHTSSAMASG